jgi:two-component system cell cycle response regulator
MTFLLVEDNYVSRVLLRSILSLRGHVVIEATTLSEARQMLSRAIPDMLLLDIQLPDGDGEILLHELRQQPHLRKLPVVAVTALAMTTDQERLLAAGFDGYFAKPIDTKAIGPALESMGRR